MPTAEISPPVERTIPVPHARHTTDSEQTAMTDVATDAHTSLPDLRQTRVATPIDAIHQIIAKTPPENVDALGGEFARAQAMPPEPMVATFLRN
jgi:hypothetical protein